MQQSAQKWERNSSSCAFGPAGLDADWYDPGLKRCPRVSACSAHTSSNTMFKLGRSIFFYYCPESREKIMNIFMQKRSRFNTSPSKPNKTAPDSWWIQIRLHNEGYVNHLIFQLGVRPPTSSLAAKKCRCARQTQARALRLLAFWIPVNVFLPLFHLKGFHRILTITKLICDASVKRKVKRNPCAQKMNLLMNRK